MLAGLLVCAVGIRGWIGPSTIELPVISRVPSFSFTDQTGQPFGSAELGGTAWIASFIYTRCPGPCPRLVRRVVELQQKHAGEGRLRYVSFSVDPKTDRPEVLAAYARQHGIDSGSWRLLTAGFDEITGFMRDTFFLEVSRTERGSAGSAQGPVIHSVHLALVDPRMRVRGFYDSSEPSALRRLERDLDLVLGETP